MYTMLPPPSLLRFVISRFPKVQRPNAEGQLAPETRMLKFTKNNNLQLAWDKDGGFTPPFYTHTKTPTGQSGEAEEIGPTTL